MAGFLVKQMVGSKIGGIKGELGKLTGEGDGAKTGAAAPEEDPEVVEARLEAEERRKEKHQQMEKEREKMRQGIREKYNIQKKEDPPEPYFPPAEGRIGSSKKKTPEELAREMNAEEDDSLKGQFSGMFSKTKATMSGLTDGIKGFLPFGK